MPQRELFCEDEEESSSCNSESSTEFHTESEAIDIEALLSHFVFLGSF